MRSRVIQPWAELYAWPDNIVESPRLGIRLRNISDGVRMDHFLYRTSFEDLPPARRGSWLGRVATSIKLARAIALLDASGMCHGDICPRNIMADPAQGGMVLLDCDGIVIQNSAPTNILGSREFLAPELVMGVARRPSPLTDRHALAVTLYRWLLYRHPLIGPKHHDMDPDLDDQLALGAKALYIEHPVDRSNRPENLRISAETLTPRMQTLFRRAFVDGLHQPLLRPTATEWERALIELFDSTIPCPNPSCDQRHFAAVYRDGYHCSLCETPLLFPEELPYFRFQASDQGDSGQDTTTAEADSQVVGWPGRALYPWHFRGESPIPGDDNTARQYATVEYSVGDRGWYLRNEGIVGLHISLPGGGGFNQIGVGDAVRLHDGIRLSIASDGVRLSLKW